MFQDICGREVAIAELHATAEQRLFDRLIELHDLQLSQQLRRMVLELCDQHGGNAMKAEQEDIALILVRGLGIVL